MNKINALIVYYTGLMLTTKFNRYFALLHAPNFFSFSPMLPGKVFF